MNVPPTDTGPGADSTEHRYPPHSLVRDYLLAGAGLAIALLPFIFASPGHTETVIFGGFGVLAAILAVRTGRRQTARYTLSAEGLTWGRRGLDWGDIASVRLRHFTTRRADPGAGWMELRLTAPGTRVTLDSDLEGFLAVARAAHAAACAKELNLDSITEVNFRALGLVRPDAAPD